MENEIKKFWWVWLPERGEPREPHNSYEKARNEATRLVKQERVKAIILEAMAVIELENPEPPVKVTMLKKDVESANDNVI